MAHVDDLRRAIAVARDNVTELEMELAYCEEQRDRARQLLRKAQEDMSEIGMLSASTIVQIDEFMDEEVA